MSERGSFITEYIYCNKCLEAIRSIFEKEECGKYFHFIQIPKYNEVQEQDLPILAGKIGGSYRGEEIQTFEDNINLKISEKICHPVRLVVIAGGSDIIENGIQSFVIEPKK